MELCLDSHETAPPSEKNIEVLHADQDWSLLVPVKLSGTRLSEDYII